MKQQQNDPDDRTKRKKKKPALEEYQELKESIEKAMERADALLKKHGVKPNNDCGYCD